MAEPPIQDIRDFHDVIRLLEEHPEWQADLRRVLLTNELLDLPRQVMKLTAQVAQIAGHMQTLGEAQQRTEAQLVTLTDQLTTLTRVQQQTTDQLATLTEIVQRQSVDVGRLKGDGLEVRYFMKGVPFVRRLIRRPSPLSAEALDVLLEEAEAEGRLSEAESEDVGLADLVIHGRRRDGGAEVYLVTEVSWGIGIDDVERAVRRAALLAKAGVTTVPAVAGEWVTPEAQQYAPGMGAWQFTPRGAVPPSS